METGTILNLIFLMGAVIYLLMADEKNKNKAYATVAVAVLPFLIDLLDRIEPIHDLFINLGTFIVGAMATIAVWILAPLMEKRLRLNDGFRWVLFAIGAIFIWFTAYYNFI